MHVERELPLLEIVLPVGISFFTFHGISYVVDVYRGELDGRAACSVDILLYSRFFPHLVAGPIVRAADFLPQIERPPRRRRASSLSRRVMLIVGGLFKKVVIANYLAAGLVDPVFSRPERNSARSTSCSRSTPTRCRSIATFSAYTDIAIGVAALLGYRFPRNFNQPYRAVELARFLAPLAHLAVDLAARLSLHPARRQAGAAMADLSQSDDHHAARRPLARRRLELRALGNAAWRHAEHRALLPWAVRVEPGRRCARLASYDQCRARAGHSRRSARAGGNLQESESRRSGDRGRIDCRRAWRSGGAEARAERRRRGGPDRGTPGRADARGSPPAGRSTA